MTPVGCRRRSASAVLIAAAVLASACASGDAGSGGTAGTESITLTINLFSSQGFGYDGIYQTYMDSHPSIKIVEKRAGVADGDEYTKNLATWLRQGHGAGDIVALEEDAIVKYQAEPDKFVNLLEYGAGALEYDYLSWKWRQGQTQDGTQLIALGTDVGGMAVCYRKDMFAEAGLPVDREAVGRLWPTWQDFLKTGKQFVASGSKKSFLSSGHSVFRVILSQIAGANSGYAFFDTNNRFVMETNPDVKAAWDATIQTIESGLAPTGAAAATDEFAGLKDGTFAVLTCPAWMTGIIAGQAGQPGAGKWDIAAAPGGGGGNSGGAFLAVPKQSEHPREAYELIKYLTSAEGQIEAWNKLGNLPSNPRALDDPAVISARSEYFSQAPIGKIFAASAIELKPVYLGPRSAEMLQVVRDALHSVAQGKRTPDQAWQDAVKNARAAIRQS